MVFGREKPLIVKPGRLRVNPHRLHADFNALSAIGSTGDGGVHRPALSEAHLAARGWLRQQAEAAGLEWRMDGAGNCSAFLSCGRASAPTLLLGSHLDSVARGGRFDGALGVLAALETLRVVKEAGLSLPVHLEAIDFTDEEGTLVGLLGSAALAGLLTEQELQHPRGGRENLLEGLARAGLSETGIFSARRDPASLAGYLELHIEQGPRLERAEANIGVVTSIAGIGSARLNFIGRADHAGATPILDRLDASLGASAFMLLARQLVIDQFPECRVNTGSLRLFPEAFNIVPERAELALEYRSPEALEFDRLETALLDLARSEAAHFHLGLEIALLGKHPPAPLSLALQTAIIEESDRLALKHISLSSGAGHDAQSLAAICPAGMIFVPSVEGASHAPRERTEWQDCLNGATVLLHTALRLAKGTLNVQH